MKFSDTEIKENFWIVGRDVFFFFLIWQLL